MPATVAQPRLAHNVPREWRLMVAANFARSRKDDHMPTYQIVYGDDQQVTRETYTDVEVQRVAGWVVLFRGTQAILRAREEHVHSLEEVTAEGE